MDDGTRERGMAVRRQVLGDPQRRRRGGAHRRVHRGLPGADHAVRLGRDLAAPWAGPANCSCITLAMLAALGHQGELGIHLRAALRVGLSTDEIKEVLLQVAIYAGVPRGQQRVRGCPAHHVRRSVDRAHGLPDRGERLVSDRGDTIVARAQDTPQLTGIGREHRAPLPDGPQVLVDRLGGELLERAAPAAADPRRDVAGGCAQARRRDLEQRRTPGACRGSWCSTGSGRSSRGGSRQPSRPRWRRARSRCPGSCSSCDRRHRRAGPAASAPR